MLFATAIERGGRGIEHGPKFLFPLLLITVLVLFFVSLKRRRGHHAMRPGYQSPMGTLADRFARGEIDRVEFEHRKAVLNGDDEIPPAPAQPAPPTNPVDGNSDDGSA